MTPQERLDDLAKPPGSLGVLEEWAIALATAQKTNVPTADPATVVVFTADHGVKKAVDSLSPFPPSVSQAIFRALAAGISGTATIARSVGAHLAVVDVGIAGDVSKVSNAAGSNISVRHAKVAEGTADFRSSPAMDEDQFKRALQVGIDCVADEVMTRDLKVLAIGEVGIGNTTAAAAVLTSLLTVDAAECCGRGTGLDDAGLAHKVDVVRAACAFHSEPIKACGDEAARAREALRRLGGLEMVAMCGAYMEAARRGVVAVVDGFISAVSALAAARIEPACRATMVFATALAEEPTAAKGGALLESALAAKPALSMDLRLGEGSGAALALPMLRSAAAIIGQMGTLRAAMELGD